MMRFLSIDSVKKFHTLLTDRLQHNISQFNSLQNAIIGATFKTASPQETPQLMQQWTDNTVYRFEQARTEQVILEVLAESHIQFERIHFFSDENGRVGRIVLLYLSLRYLSVPIIINNTDRAI